MSETVELLIKNAADLGEGPHWDEATQCLYYVDLYAGDVCRYNTVTKDVNRQNLGKVTASIVIPRQKGGFVVSRNLDIAVLDTWDSTNITTIAQIPDPHTNILNDGKVDATGRLWIGSCFNGKDTPDIADWPKEVGSLYSIDADGKIKKHQDKFSISNGMDWDNSNSTMYFIDFTPRKIFAFDFDIINGTISNQRTMADFSSPELPDMGFPDGMTVDAEGKLWVACFDGGKVVRLDPETGKVIRTVKLPAKIITSCCFGGDDYSDLYVTSKKSPGDVNNMTMGGSIFKVTGLGVKGRRPNIFAG